MPSCILTDYNVKQGTKVEILVIYNKQNQFYIQMFLPTIVKSDNQLSKRLKLLSLNKHPSQKQLTQPKRIIKERYYTQDRQGYIGKKLLNYIGFDRVKGLKSYTQICKQNMKKYQQEKKQLQSLHASRQCIQSQLRRNKVVLSPRGNSMKINLKTNEASLSRKKIDILDFKQRLKTQAIVVTNDGVKVKNRSDKCQTEQNCLQVKKYSQLSIRQIIQKDLAEVSARIKHKFYQHNHKKSLRFEGW